MNSSQARIILPAVIFTAVLVHFFVVQPPMWWLWVVAGVAAIYTIFVWPAIRYPLQRVYVILESLVVGSLAYVVLAIVEWFRRR